MPAICRPRGRIRSCPERYTEMRLPFSSTSSKQFTYLHLRNGVWAPLHPVCPFLDHLHEHNSPEVLQVKDFGSSVLFSRYISRGTSCCGVVGLDQAASLSAILIASITRSV